MITAVAVSPSLDVTYVVDELRGIQRPLDVHRMAGGKALNAARAAAALGADVAAVAVLGGGTGTVVADGARRAGVRLVALDGAGTTRTCTSIFSRSTGELTEIYEQPTPVDADVFADLLRRLDGLLRERPGWCVVSGGIPVGLGEGALAAVVRTAHDAGARVAVDSHGPALSAALAGRPPEVLKVNRSEAAELLDLPADLPLVDLVGPLQVVTGGLVVVTDGVAGALAMDGDVTVRAALPGQVGSFPVGSGDSFLAGLLVALDRGDGLADALRLATACATANALVPGAARFEPSLVDALLADVQVEPVALSA